MIYNISAPPFLLHSLPIFLHNTEKLKLKCEYNIHIFQPLWGDEYIGSLLNSTWSTVHFMEFSAPPAHEPKVENKIY